MSNRKLSKEEVEALWRDPENWKWGYAFYSCKDDPRVCVPKKLRWTGWTFNLAHPHIVPFIFLALVVGGGPVLLFCMHGIKSPIMFLQVIIPTIAALVWLGWYFSRIR